MSILSNFTAYVKQVWANRPTLTSPLSAARLNHMEAGIKANSDAVEAISNAVISNIINDPNKIASMATAYALQQQITQLNSDFTVRTKTFSGQTISPNGYVDCIDSTITQGAIVGYELLGVASSNVSVVVVKIQSDVGLLIRIKNNGNSSVTTGEVKVNYLTKGLFV